MGRRSDHSREELEALFIESAKAVLWEKGHIALSVRQIAARAGYSVGTLYNVFGSLSTLILKINAQTLELLKLDLEQVLTSEQHNSHLGRSIGRAYIRFGENHRPFWDLLFSYQLPEGNSLPEWYQEKVDHVFNVLEKALANHVSGDPQVLSRAGKVLWAGLHGICILALSGKLATTGAEPPEKLCDSLFSHYLEGLSANFATA